MTKRFHVGDVLSVYSGYLVSMNGMDGVCDVLNFLTRDDLFTHQLPRAMEECHGYLERAHPFLTTIDCSSVGTAEEPLTEETLRQWLDSVVAQHGAMVELTPMPEDAHEYRHPLEELQAMVGNKPILVVSTADLARGHILRREPGYSHAHWRIVERARVRHRMGLN